MGTLCLLVVWHLTRERYLLREGASRYTVAWVYEYGSQRGFHTFLYRYRVAGYDGQGYLRCGVSYERALPCPPLGTRFYVQFSPEEPAVEQITQLEVPDTVRTVPPLGWARLPECPPPAAARRRVAWHHAGQQIDALREDQALNNTIGQGIGYGFAAAAAELAPGFVALRLAGSRRWAGATRAAVVAGRLAEQASWAGAEGELIGIRSGWQGLRKAPKQ